MRYLIDPSVEVFAGGRVLLGGQPTRLLRLSDAGARVVSRWIADGADDSGPMGERRLLDRLVDAAMAHPTVDTGGAEGPVPEGRSDRLVVVVPVRDRAEGLDACLTALVDGGAGRIVVVDDGSVDAAAHRTVAEDHGATVVRRPVSGGPSAARMTGWNSVRATGTMPDVVAFVDSDVIVGRDWLSSLLAHLADERVGLVAPRVVHRGGPGVVDRYEVGASPLDLGPDPAPVVAGTRVSYVPAAALVVRAAAFEAVDGFDPSLHVGEDVDLVWRLADAGWRCRYEPASRVEHIGRSRPASMLRRRFDYGRSAAVLDARHRGSVPPVRGSRWSASVLAAAAAGHPVVAGAVVAGNVVAMRRKLAGMPDDLRVATRLVLRGHLAFARQVALAVVRPWWPIAAVAVLAGRRARSRVLLAATAGAYLAARGRRSDLAPAQRLALSLADDAAYAAGVWWGCVDQRRAGPLLPDIG